MDEALHVFVQVFHPGQADVPDARARALQAALRIIQGGAVREADVHIAGVGRQVDEVVGVALGEAVGHPHRVGGVPHGFDAVREQVHQAAAQRAGELLCGRRVRGQELDVFGGLGESHAIGTSIVQLPIYRTLQ